MMAGNVDMRVVSKRLGHSSISFTVDTYSHLLEDVNRWAGEVTEGMVPRGPRDHSVTGSANPRAVVRPEDDAAGVSPAETPAATGAPPGTRTPNPRIKSPLLCH